MDKPKPTPQDEGEKKSKEGDNDLDSLLPLFRLLVRQPPKDHDFKACPICQRYGITKV
jgi:hypothetical protein